MWRLKHLKPKDHAKLEGKSLEIGKFRVNVHSTIAEGGFSVVYLAKCVQTGQSYALKHILCSEEESSVLLKKEIGAMLNLKGHPNVVTLHAHTIIKTGKYEECFLLMDYCEKMLTSIIDARGSNYFEEKQILLIFRDVCNAVFAMHSQNPPIAHRDLKTENVLLSNESVWKLCDFGSISTKHRRIETAEERGIEEEVIRKHTTPAFRAPELCDLYKRELINEKVDIWALGCILYQIAFFKLCFDGESKLQILNGNYRVPETPKYSSLFMKLIKDMLCINPSDRPDILQVWQRVNSLLPIQIRRSQPDHTPLVLKQIKNRENSPLPRRNSASSSSSSPPTVVSNSNNPTSQSPASSVKRNPSPQVILRRQSPPSPELVKRSPSPKPWKLKESSTPDAPAKGSQDETNSGQRGSFWSTAYAQGTESEESQSLDFDPRGQTLRSKSNSKTINDDSKNESDTQSSAVSDSQRLPRGNSGNFAKAVRSPSPANATLENEGRPYGFSDSDMDTDRGSSAENKPDYKKNAEANGGTRRGFPISSSGRSISEKSGRVSSREYASENTDFVNNEVLLQALQEELKKAKEEKEALVIRCDKLSYIVGSQMQEIQELKIALESAEKMIATINYSQLKAKYGKDTRFDSHDPLDSEPYDRDLGRSDSDSLNHDRMRMDSKSPMTSSRSSRKSPNPSVDSFAETDPKKSSDNHDTFENWASFDDKTDHDNESNAFGFDNADPRSFRRSPSPLRNHHRGSQRSASPLRNISPLRGPGDGTSSKNSFANWDNTKVNVYSGNNFQKPAGWDQF